MGFSCDGNTDISQYNQSLINQDIFKKRYRYDSILRQCVPFGYFGCGGNWNHFYTENLCALRCRKNLSTLIIIYFSFSFYRTIS